MQPRPQRTGIVPRTDTEAVAAHDEFGPLAGSQRITIDANNAGDGSAVSFHVGRRIMRLPGNDIVVLIVQAPHARIVP